MAENVEALENVVKGEPHFFMEIVDNDLRAFTMITKHFMNDNGKGIVLSQWQKVWWQRWKRWFHGGKWWWLVSQMLDCVKRGLWWCRFVVRGGKSSSKSKNRSSKVEEYSVWECLRVFSLVATFLSEDTDMEKRGGEQMLLDCGRDCGMFELIGTATLLSFLTLACKVNKSYTVKGTCEGMLHDKVEFGGKK
ncbi:hypothetical protein Tco_1280820 [Tanacetum coccineum]